MNHTPDSGSSLESTSRNLSCCLSGRSLTTNKPCDPTARTTIQDRLLPFFPVHDGCHHQLATLLVLRSFTSSHIAPVSLRQGEHWRLSSAVKCRGLGPCFSAFLGETEHFNPRCVNHILFSRKLTAVGQGVGSGGVRIRIKGMQCISLRARSRLSLGYIGLVAREMCCWSVDSEWPHSQSRKLEHFELQS